MNLDKADIRKQVRMAVKRLSEQEKISSAQAVFGKIESLPEFAAAKTVLLFMSLPDEIPTHRYVEKWAAEKNVLLPVVDGDDLLLRRYVSGNNMHVGSFGISEPAGDNFIDFPAIDLAVVPGMAFAPDGTRLGRGKGFYDRLLPKIRAPKLGVCFEEQVVPHLPHDTWDVPMDIVISPKSVFRTFFFCFRQI